MGQARRLNAVAIVNPNTGVASRPHLAELLKSTAAQHNVTLTIIATTHAGETTDLARANATNADILIAVGGDGTVSDVITGSVGNAITIGIIPAGSTNMIAKELGIPRNIQQAAEIAFGGGQVRAIDVARVGDSTTCVHMIGAGYDAEIMARVDPALKRRLRWVAYLPPAIRLLRYPGFNATITVDGKTIRRHARLVLCALGGSFIHPRFRVGEGIDRTDGWIEVCLWDPPGLLATLTSLGWIAMGKPGRSRWLRQTRGKRIALSADRPVPLEVDGDHIGELPTVIQILEEQVTVFVP